LKRFFGKGRLDAAFKDNNPLKINTALQMEAEKIEFRPRGLVSLMIFLRLNNHVSYYP
jgi:hypothetical protein